MKTKVILMAAVAAMASFTSCSKDETSIQDAKGTELVFSLAPKAGLTRADAGRDVYSSVALQYVTDMKVYAFKKNADGDFVYTTVTTVETGNTPQSGYDIPWEKGDLKHEYKVTPKLTEGDVYKFLAVGLDADKTNFDEIVLDSKKIEEVVLAIKANSKCREAFAGVSEEITIPSSATQLKVNITLNRVVAGILGYFKNIPAKVADVDVKSIAVVMYTKPNTTVNLTTKIGAIPFLADTEKTLISLAIPADATVNDGIYEFTQTLPQGVVAVANSLLGGAFAMPMVAPTNGTYTLQVQLRNNAGDALKTWNVKIDTKQADDTDENLRLYSLKANHFYSIGKKVSDGSTEGPDPENPDPDQPTDLSKDQDIVITVNPNWETVHQMGIE